MKVSVQDHSDWFSPNGQIHPRPCPFCQQTRIRPQRAIVETNQGQEKFSYWLVCHDCKSTGPVAGTELQAAQLWGILHANRHALHYAVAGGKVLHSSGGFQLFSSKEDAEKAADPPLNF